MERRFVLFLVFSFAILILWGMVVRRPQKEQRPPAKQQQAARADGQRDAPKKETQNQDKAKEQPPKPGEKPEEGETEIIAPEPGTPKYVTLGSADPDDPYRMLVTLGSKGACVERIELNSPRYRDLNQHGGYLGNLVVDEEELDPARRQLGCVVKVVGRGTPAHKAGLKPGDVITAIAKRPVTGPKSLAEELKKIKPNREVELTVLRPKDNDNETEKKPTELTLSVTLGYRPLELIRPAKYGKVPGEEHPSFLLTLHQLDGKELDRPENTVDVGDEFPGLHLWDGNWEFQEGKDKDGNPEVVFWRVIQGSEQSPLLKITKTYRLKRVPDESIQQTSFPAYNLEFEIEIRNMGDKTREVAYQLDGPSGLVTEGIWYANKVSRSWGSAGLRDMVVSFDGAVPEMINCPAIADDDVEKPWTDKSVTYIGIDTQYFSSELIPQKEDPHQQWFARSNPLRVGKAVEDRLTLTNTSCRLISKVHKLEPGAGKSSKLNHRFVIFAGPKRPALLEHYGLGELVYYGWFEWLARPMVVILHFFHGIVKTYGLAIILLTVLVRCGMFPLSRKQVLGAQKMQELQPELKKLQEKYKKDMQARSKAQQELFRKHNCNPLSGCLVLFVQLPIFVALYRSLMVDVELRDAPLLWRGLGWCSDLAAPDMLFNWSGFMPEFITSGRGILGLGPYFNILPLMTVVLFILQQKMFMPPPADDQARMQQKIMKFMMVFIGLLFFKVASGLCVYFIASSLWGLAERKFMPKPAHKLPQAKPETRADAKARAQAQSEAKAKMQARTQAKSQTGPKSQEVSAGGDGSPTGKKRKRKRQKNRGKR